MHRRVRHSLIANYAGQGWAAIMAIAFLPIYVQKLGIESYGLIGFFTTIQMVLAVLDLGMSPTLMREAALDPTSRGYALASLVKTCELLSLAIGVILSVTIWLSAPWIASHWIVSTHLNFLTVSNTVTLMGGMLGMRLMEGVYRGTLVGLNRQVELNLLTAGIATIRYAGALLVISTESADILTFFRWQFAMSVLSLSILTIAHYIMIPAIESKSPPMKLDQFYRTAKFSVHMALVGGISIAMANIDKLILSKFLPLSQFGHYSLAAVGASVLYSLVVPLTQAVYPRLVTLSQISESPSFGVVYRGSSQLAMLIVGSSAILLSTFSQNIIFVWSGNEILSKSIAPLLTVLSIASLANCLGHLGYNLLVAAGKPKPLVWNGVATIFAVTLLLPPTVIAYGVLGATYVWAGICLLQSLITLLMAHRLLSTYDIKGWCGEMAAMFSSMALLAVVARLLISTCELGRWGQTFFIFVVEMLLLLCGVIFSNHLRKQFTFLRPSNIDGTR